MKAGVRTSAHFIAPLIALVLLFATQPTLAQQQQQQVPAQGNTITWVSAEPAPQHASPEASGQAALRSFLEGLGDHLKSHWPDAAIRHVVLRSNAKRAWQMVSSGEPVCVLSAIHTPEREKTAYFSDTLMGPPQQLLVRRDRLTALPRNANGEVDLPRLLADGSLRGAVVEARSYGTVIDAALEKAGKNANVARYATSDYGSRLLTMLTLDRADYTIGYEVSLTDDVAGALVSETIAGASTPVIGGVACPRNAWGLATIRKVDQILGTPSGAALLRKEAESWLSTAEMRKRYGPRLDEFYRQRAKPSVIR